MTRTHVPRVRPSGRIAERLIVAGGLALATFGLMVLFPTIFFHYAGTDAGHYANAAAHYAYGYESSSVFYPPELEDPARIDSALVIERGGSIIGLMTYFIPVAADYTIGYPHSHLFPRVAAFLQPLADYLNYGFLFGAAFLAYLILRRFGLGVAAALVGALLMLFLPSQVALARYQMSEPITVFLLLVTIYLSFSRSQWALLPLGLLVHARPEFIPVALLVLIYLGFRHPRYWPISLVLVVSMYAGNAVKGASLWESLNFALHHMLEVPDDWLAKPWRLEPMAPLFYVAGFLAGLLPWLQARAEQFGRWYSGSKAIVFVSVVVLVAVAVGADLIRMGLEPGEKFFGVITHQRYFTIPLLVRSSGLLVIGVVGLAFHSDVPLRRLPAYVVPFLVLLLVLMSMAASPPNELWWTRRFHVIVYPLLIFGVALLFDRHVRRWTMLAVPVVLMALLIPVANRYPDIRDGYLSSETIGAFHDAADCLPEGAVVLLAPRTFNYKPQLPLRTFHGLWSYVVSKPERLDTVIGAFGRLDRPILVDAELLDGEPSYALPVYETTERGRTIQFVELRESARARAASTRCSSPTGR